MANKFAFLFPGQGAQYVGMGKDFCTFSRAKETFEEADDLLGENLSKMIWEGPTEKLTETRNSQLAIFVVSAAILHVVQEQMSNLVPHMCAGLSLGEYTALYATGKLTFKDALFLIQKRALFMDEACRASKGSMAAVLGMDAATIEKVLTANQLHTCVWLANLNCPGQIVISGTAEGIQAALGPLKEAGAKRALPLQVHGAFHSPLMRPAQDKLEPHIRMTLFAQTPIELVMNVSGEKVIGSQIADSLVKQVTSPVRWEQSILSMQKEGVSFYLEMGCGKTLSGLNRKIVPDAKAISIDKVSDLDELHKSIL